MMNDNRRSSRVHLQWPVSADVGPDTPLRPCLLVDVSAIGAKLQVETPGDMPEEFAIVLSYRGVPRRNCRVVWRSGEYVAVSFQPNDSRPSRCA